MKRFFILLFLTIFCSNLVYSANIPSNKMQVISDKKTVRYDSASNAWVTVKKKNNIETFDTGCDVKFLYKGRLIAFSNSYMTFFEFLPSENGISKVELNFEEMEQLFPSYKLIKISDFSTTTNSLKIKKHVGKLRLAIINDTKFDFKNYKFTSGNAKFKTYDMSNFVDVEKAGMLQFSSDNEEEQEIPWYVILVR